MKYPRGAAGTDLFLFFLFIIALGVIWTMTGGPERSISHAGPFLSSPLEGGFGIPGVQIPGVSTSTSASSTSIFSSVGNGLLNLQEGEEKSPYAEYVSLSISNAKDSDPNKEYLTIKTSNTLSGTLTISDWRLESTVSGASAALGGAVRTPYLGQLNTAVPAAVGANTTVYVTTGRSPVGMSFRVNSCTGYFAQYQTFVPQLPLDCAAPYSELGLAAQKYPGFSPSSACSYFVSGLGQCSFVGAEKVPSNVEQMCRDIVLNDLSYNGCLSLHERDADFLKNEWRLFLGQGNELWKQEKERIRLLDENGRVIDVVSY